MSLKILLSIHHYLDPNSGASGATVKLGQSYEKLGHQVHYFSIDNLPAKLPEKIKHFLFPWFFAIHVFRLTQQKTIDVIDASTGDAWVWAKHLSRVVRSKPLLVTRAHGLEHTADYHLKREFLKRGLKLSWKYRLYGGGFRLWEVTNSMRYADLVFQLNQFDLDYAVQQLGVAADRSYLVANGIPEEFLNLPFESTPMSASSEIAIALVATYNFRKGIHYSIPALNAILKKYPMVKISFLGTGVTEETVHADFEANVCDRVHVIPHFGRAELPNLLKGHHIKLFPSISEGFSLALPEAMACGLAPVATAIPGSVEILRDGHDSILIPACDSKAIEEALERLVRNREGLEKLRRNALITSNKYGWERIAQYQLSIYQKTIVNRC
jgi:glycosyltransferase involved in cell wall biosynthesis